MRILLEPKTVALNMACLQHDVIMLTIDVSCTLAESADADRRGTSPSLDRGESGRIENERGGTHRCALGFARCVR